MKINTFGIFGYNGGKSKKIVDEFIHTAVMICKFQNAASYFIVYAVIEKKIEK